MATRQIRRVGCGRGQRVEFVKGHATGNDFILLPDPEGRLQLSPGLVRGLCAAHTGLGADGVIRVAPARSGMRADVFMDYWNRDGTVAEQCGNGVRSVAKYVADRRSTRPVPGTVVSVDTRAGVKAVEVTAVHRDGRVAEMRVDMGVPQIGKVGMPLRVGDVQVELTTLSMGNPHAVLVVDDLGSAPVGSLGPAIEAHPQFPEGTNVEFIAVRSRREVTGRIWERGVGETLASGTGASAMAAAAATLGLADRYVTVRLPGGTLDVGWAEQALLVTGPAVEVATGQVDETWLKTLST